MWDVLKLYGVRGPFKKYLTFVHKEKNCVHFTNFI